MSFKILNSENQPVPINELDREAAEFWGQPIKDREYATPKLEEEISFYFVPNWFDKIGHAIHRPEKYTKGWDDVKCTMMASALGGIALKTPEQAKEYLGVCFDVLKPYFDLVDHWASKGYTPLTVDES